MAKRRKTPEADRPPDGESVILLTGFPSYLAHRVARELLASRAEARLFLLHDCEAPQLDSFLSSLDEAARRRVEPLAGNVAHMDLGLPSDAYRRLMGELTEVHHLASAYHDHHDGRTLRRVNVVGTREVVELASQCEHQPRLVHWSTILVSGTRTGVVLEDELECGQRFRTAYEQTRYEAERLVRRAARKLPVVVLRLGVVVGDSRTGELAPYDGPHGLIAGMVEGRADQAMRLPGTGDAPVHLVPVDFVVQAGCHLSGAPDTQGKTFHLVDPCPLPAREVFQLVARKAHRGPTPQAVPAAISRLLRLSPRMERLAPFPVAPPELFDHLVFYNCQNTMTHLSDTPLRCPPLASYVEQLVRFIKDRGAARHRVAEEAPADPFV
jgi:thioester reductase-like protein